MGKRNDTYLVLWRERDRRSKGVPMRNVGTRRQNLAREVWLCLGMYRVSVEMWNNYLVGREREM